MLQRRGQLCFLHEPATALIVGDEFRRQNLQRDGAIAGYRDIRRIHA